MSNAVFFWTVGLSPLSNDQQHTVRYSHNQPPLRARPFFSRLKHPEAQAPSGCFNLILLEVSLLGEGSARALDADPAQFREFVQRRFAAHPPVTAAFDAAKGNLRLVVHSLVVDVNHARVEVLRHVERLVEVVGDDARRKPIFGVVRHVQGFFSILHDNDWRDGSESLIGENLHTGCHIGQHRRLIDKPLIRTTREYVRATRVTPV